MSTSHHRYHRLLPQVEGDTIQCVENEEAVYACFGSFFQDTCLKT